MTRGKKALSDMPRNQRTANRPLKFFTPTKHSVQMPKQNIMTGSTLLGPYFMPKMPNTGAVRT